jgi:hypothetical protein
MGNGFLQVSGLPEDGTGTYLPSTGMTLNANTAHPYEAVRVQRWCLDDAGTVVSSQSQVFDLTPALAASRAMTFSTGCGTTANAKRLTIRGTQSTGATSASTSDPIVWQWDYVPPAPPSPSPSVVPPAPSPSPVPPSPEPSPSAPEPSPTPSSTAPSPAASAPSYGPGEVEGLVCRQQVCTMRLDAVQYVVLCLIGGLVAMLLVANLVRSEAVPVLRG